MSKDFKIYKKHHIQLSQLCDEKQKDTGTALLPVFRIHYILGWIQIRILGSMLLTN
jgi:hypothetical protein